MVYISLQEASTLCPYSQEYLSLRARQKKLKGVKIGRNWATTREWIEEYLVKSEEYKKLNGNHRVVVDPPRNLPIYDPEADMWEDDIPEDIERQKAFQRKFQFALATSLVAALFLVSIFQGREQVFRVAERVSPIVISSVASLHGAVNEKGFAIGNEMKSYFAASIGEIAKSYVAWLGDQVQRVARIFRTETKPMTQGLVVIPSSSDDEKVKEQIKQSFSDEVKVTPYDGESGIITPVFRHRVGEDYLYILVPIQNGKSQ